MRKIYKPLTEDQKNRGVIFSSTLSNCTTELPCDMVHEVFENDRDRYATIKNLKDVRFFRNSPWRYCIERK